MGTWQGMEATLTGDRPPLMMDALLSERRRPPSLLVAVELQLSILMKIVASAAVVDEDDDADGSVHVSDVALRVCTMPPSDADVAGTIRPTGVGLLPAVLVGLVPISLVRGEECEKADEPETMDWHTTSWSVDVATFSQLLPVEGLTKSEVETNGTLAGPTKEEMWALVLLWLAVVGAGAAGAAPSLLVFSALGTRVRFGYLGAPRQSLLPPSLLLGVETAATDGIELSLLSCRFLFAWS